MKPLAHRGIGGNAACGAKPRSIADVIRGEQSAGYVDCPQCLELDVQRASRETTPLSWAAEHGWSEPPRLAAPADRPRNPWWETPGDIAAIIAANRRARRMTVLGPDGEPLEVPR